MTADPALYDRLEQLAAEATPGPWSDTVPGMIHNDPRGRVKGGYIASVEHPANAALIVALVNALPQILDDMRTARRATDLEQRVQALAEELEGWRDNAERFASSVAYGPDYERSMGRIRAYERALDGLRGLLDGGAA